MNGIENYVNERKTSTTPRNIYINNKQFNITIGNNFAC